MWQFLIAIVLSCLVVLVLLIFYVSPELTQVTFGPTGPTGPTDYEQTDVTAQFLDGTTSVVSSIVVSFVRIGQAVTMTVPAFSFDDGAVPPTGEIATTAIVPVNLRPQTTTSILETVYTGSRKIGLVSVTPAGQIQIYVNATVTDLVHGDAWAASGNVVAGFSVSYNLTS